MKLFVLIGSVVVILVTAAVLYLLTRSDSSSSSLIPPMSTLEEARKLSKGAKGACLGDNPEAITAVKADDAFIDEAEEFSRFELAASEGIMDIPAGTNYETTINRYNDSIATGTIEYEKDYGKYNYTIKKSSGAGEWEFMSLKACE